MRKITTYLRPPSTLHHLLRIQNNFTACTQKYNQLNVLFWLQRRRSINVRGVSNLNKNLNPLGSTQMSFSIHRSALLATATTFSFSHLPRAFASISASQRSSPDEDEFDREARILEQRNRNTMVVEAQNEFYDTFSDGATGYTVTTTTDEAAEAEKLRQAITELAEDAANADIKQFMVNSAYFWDGEVQNDEEYRLEFSTSKPFAQVEERIAKVHNYDTPMILAEPLPAAVQAQGLSLGASGSAVPFWRLHIVVSPKFEADLVEVIKKFVTDKKIACAQMYTTAGEQFDVSAKTSVHYIEEFRTAVRAVVGENAEEVTAIPVVANHGYLQWIADTTLDNDVVDKKVLKKAVTDSDDLSRHLGTFDKALVDKRPDTLIAPDLNVNPGLSPASSQRQIVNEL